MTDASDDTVRITRTDAVDGSTGPRQPAPDGDDHPDGFTGGITDDGSTVVARRESRRRQDRAAAGVAAPRPTAPAGTGSAARPPAMSAVRAPAPIIVPRATPAAHTPQAVVDTAAGDAARRRRSRRLALLVVAAASVLVVIAAAALIVLLAIG